MAGIIAFDGWGLQADGSSGIDRRRLGRTIRDRPDALVGDLARLDSSRETRCLLNSFRISFLAAGNAMRTSAAAILSMTLCDRTDGLLHGSEQRSC